MSDTSRKAPVWQRKLALRLRRWRESGAGAPFSTRSLRASLMSLALVLIVETFFEVTRGVAFLIVIGPIVYVYWFARR